MKSPCNCTSGAEAVDAVEPDKAVDLAVRLRREQLSAHRGDNGLCTGGDKRLRRELLDLQVLEPVGTGEHGRLASRGLRGCSSSGSGSPPLATSTFEDR